MWAWQDADLRGDDEGAFQSALFVDLRIGAVVGEDAFAVGLGNLDPRRRMQPAMLAMSGTMLTSALVKPGRR